MRLSSINFIINSFDRFSYYQYYDLTASGRGWDINIVLYIIHAIVIAFAISVLNQYMREYKENKYIEHLRFSNQLELIYEVREYSEIFSYMICIVFSLGLNLASVVMGSAARMCQYFFVFMILDIPLLLRYLHGKNKILIRMAVVVMFIIYCILMLSHNNYYVVPYSFCF